VVTSRQLLVIPNPNGSSALPGAIWGFEAVLLDSTGLSVVTDLVTWRQSDTTIARQGQVGHVFTFLQGGVDTITATLGSLIGQPKVVVTVTPRTSLSVTGVKVFNLPSQPVFTFPALPMLMTGSYTLRLLGIAKDTVGVAECQVTPR
jgi:hypothetical protein